jgi:hypothetical protein
LDFDEAVNLAQRMTSNYHSHRKDKKESDESKNIKPQIKAKRLIVVLIYRKMTKRPNHAKQGKSKFIEINLRENFKCIEKSKINTARIKEFKLHHDQTLLSATPSPSYQIQPKRGNEGKKTERNYIKQATVDLNENSEIKVAYCFKIFRCRKRSQW